MANNTFTILDDGETLITGEWSPDPVLVGDRMVALADSYDNLIVPLMEARQIAIDSTEIHFDEERDPQGNPWESLNLDYLADKVRAGYPSDEILVRTGEGKKAALSEEAWFITEDALWFDGSSLPDYMALHQTGTQSEALGSALRKISTSMTEPTFTRAEAEALKTGTGRGKNLPKREFIGLNEFDIELIEGVFNKWFVSNLIDFFPTETGFNLLGEFPIISRTTTGQPILRTPAGPRFGRK